MARSDIEEADYVIVGAGSAGCVLANRLTEDGKSTVILLEAGADDRPLHALGQFWSNMHIHVPVGFTRTASDPKVNWLFETEPDVNGRRISWPRGKVLGGSSSINGMLYVRGQHADYDGWRQLGCDGWSWSDVLPYFRKSQDHAPGEDHFHGRGGPLHVSQIDEHHPVCDAFLAACEEAGLPVTDTNGADQEGAQYLHVNVRNGRRASAAVSYLHPAMRRPNLAVRTKALASRVLITEGRAVGVEFTQDGATHRVRARREVILSGGAINSPQLLQLSGIGPAELLQQYGIAPQVISAGVGHNLQDHYLVALTYRLQDGTPSINERTRGARLYWEYAKYGLARRGILGMAPVHITAFCKSRVDLEHPDIQLQIMPATRDHPRSQQTGRFLMEREPGLTMTACQLRPESRGSVLIRSADPADHPAIVANYLADPIDREVLLAGMDWCRRLAAQPALASLVARELIPGADVDTQEAMLGYARASGNTVYHPVGTCRMGSDPDAVVDTRLRVRGVEGLRVVDASIMPRLISGNTNAPTIMIAEKAADMIRADARAR